MTTATETGARSLLGKTVLGVFVAVPFVGLVVGVPWAFATGWVTWLDLTMGAALYAVGVLGVTVGYHRLFTHRSFRAARGLRVSLAVAGSVAVEGRVIDWVADHRRHHASSDVDGDPHSPWLHGPGTWGLVKGLFHSHVGWLFVTNPTSLERYAPDLIGDRDLERVNRWWPFIAGLTFVIPAAVGAAVDGWAGAARALLWAGLVRVAMVHHVTWSVNSVCHVWGRHPFLTRDRSGNVAWLSVLSGGESWHNYHHADPSSARHGVLPRQVDVSAAIIALFERAGWASHVHWPSQERVASKMVDPAFTAEPAPAL